MTYKNHISWKKVSIFLATLIISIIAFGAVFALGVFLLAFIGITSHRLLLLVFIAFVSIELLFAIFVFKKMQRYLKNGIVTLSFFVLLIVSYVFLDTMKAYVLGTPVRLVSATGPISTALPVFTHAFVRNGNLCLIIRCFFYNTETLTKPYITVDSKQNGVLHIGVKAYLPSLAKCEFLRQVEIEIPAAQWKQLKSLQIYNHDIAKTVSEPMQISNPAYLKSLLRQSQEQLGIEDVTGSAAQGCGS